VTPDPTPVAPAPVVVTPPPAVAPDLAPSVFLTAPTTGATFVDVLRVRAGAADDRGVARVELWIDGVRRATDTSAPYAFDWQAPRKLSYGSHKVTVKVFDTAGNQASASASVRRVLSRTARSAVAARKARAAKAAKAKRARAKARGAAARR
jgi:hypothetical protein